MTATFSLRVDRQTPVHRLVSLARLAAGRTAEEVATAMGISESSYRRLESGAREARRGELIAIAQITGQDLALFGGASLSAEDGPATVTPSPGEIKESFPANGDALGGRVAEGAAK